MILLRLEEAGELIDMIIQLNLINEVPLSRLTNIKALIFHFPISVDVLTSIKKKKVDIRAIFAILVMFCI